MFHISKEFHFSASHQLTSLPPNHQCARLHGHNYVVVVQLSAKE
ncbi:MAG: 6-carboxytetrahydropterin synthase QueD, partial [Mesorhizobium sp.]